MPLIPVVTESVIALKPAITEVKRPFLSKTADSFEITSASYEKENFFQKIDHFFQSLFGRIEQFLFGKAKPVASPANGTAKEIVSDVTKRHRLSGSGTTILESLDKQGRIFQREHLRSDGSVSMRERLDKNGTVFQRDAVYPNGHIAQQEFLNKAGQTMGCNLLDQTGRITAREFMNEQGGLARRDLLNEEGKTRVREFFDKNEKLTERHILDEKGQVVTEVFYDKNEKLILPGVKNVE